MNRFVRNELAELGVVVLVLLVGLLMLAALPFRLVTHVLLAPTPPLLRAAANLRDRTQRCADRW